VSTPGAALVGTSFPGGASRSFGDVVADIVASGVTAVCSGGGGLLLRTA